jgi:hypothetical protein
MAEINFKDVRYARVVLTHTKDGEIRRLSFTDVLTILDFVMAGIQAIMFTHTGKFKTILQLIWSLPAIISFLKKVVDMVTGKEKPHPFEPKVAKDKKAVKAAIKTATDARP